MDSFDEKTAALNKSEPMRELQNLAYMYYAVGNYAKADEILSLLEGMKERKAKCQDDARRWDDDHPKAA